MSVICSTKESQQTWTGDGQVDRQMDRRLDRPKYIEKAELWQVKDE